MMMVVQLQTIPITYHEQSHFEAPIGYRLRIEEQTIDISPAKTTIACVNSNTGGNDVLTIFDGTFIR
jgi:hypothetical protein